MKFEVFHTKYRQQLEQIFFETSSRKNFADDIDRQNFLYKYLGHYLEHYPQSTFVCINEDKVLGYITICPDTSADLTLVKFNPNLKQYSDHYRDYPAHLHINMTASAQGTGAGSKLLNYALEQLSGIGIHLVTLQNARNLNFYLKNHFEVVEKYSDGTVLLGRRLEH